MELELEQEVILCYEMVGQASACQEETQESIVPDACPDVLRIADVCAQAFVSRWEAKEGQAAVYGFIQAAVLYIPELGHSLRKLDMKIPFTAHIELSGLTSDCVLEVSTRLRCVDSRMLNPRKILLRADLATEITAFRRKDHAVCTGAFQADDEKICQLVSHLNHERIVSVPQRIFPMSEEIRLTGTQGQTVLSCRGECLCTECRVIGGKLIFKGKTDVILLLQGEDGGIDRRIETFPFSQILDAKGTGDSASGQVRLELAELVCRPVEENGLRLMLEWEVLAQGQIREQETVSLLTDLYSTADHVELKEEHLKLFAPGEQQIQPQTFRDMLETGDVVRAVCDSRFLLGPVRCFREDSHFVYAAQGQVVILYLDEERQLRQIRKDVELSARVQCSEGSRVQYRVHCPGELYAAPCVGGIEVRMNLEFQFWIEAPLVTRIVSGCRLGESRKKEGPCPSMILRRPDSGESLWDVAKSCGTTRQRIMQANELSGEEIPEHKMLLIPGVR